MSVVEGVEGDLAGYPDDLRTSGLAALARSMAERIDSGRGSPSECGKVLIETLGKLRDLAPVEEEGGELHGIKSKRAVRLIQGGAAG